jgi:hypothetical protein
MAHTFGRNVLNSDHYSIQPSEWRAHNLFNAVTTNWKLCHWQVSTSNIAKSVRKGIKYPLTGLYLIQVSV